MAITYPLSLPSTFRVAKSSFYLDFNVRAFERDFSEGGRFEEQNSGKSDRWRGTLKTTVHNNTELRTISAFINALNGREGTFNLFDPDRKEPQTLSGAFPGSGLVNGASQTGMSLITDGWATDGLILMAGDLIQVETQVYELTDDATATSGAATLYFQPAIRTAPANNAAVVTSEPKIIARLTEPFILIATDALKNGAVNLEFEEVL